MNRAFVCCERCRPKAVMVATAAIDLLADVAIPDGTRRVAYDELLRAAHLLSLPPGVPTVRAGESP